MSIDQEAARSSLNAPCEAQQILLVCPEHRLILPHVHTGHDVVEMDDDIFSTVSNHHNEASLFLLGSCSA